MGAELQYTVGRAFAVLTRPLYLFAANNYLPAATAEGLAIALLACALALVGTAADPHRRFYMQHFSSTSKASGLSFYVYVWSVVLLAALGSALVFTIGLKFSGSLALGSTIVLYFLSEKLADEVLRFRLFERDYASWGRISSARSVLQLAGLAALFLLLGNDAPVALFVAVLAFGNFAAFAPHARIAPSRFPRLLALHRIRWLTLRASASIVENRLLWVIALLTSLVSYLDRVVALVVDKATLPLFTLVVMCFYLIPLAFDFYYVSRHRRDFLEQTITIGRALGSRDFLLSLAGGSAAALLACAMVLHFSHNGAEFPLGYVIVIALLQTSAAVATVPQQILYWNKAVRRILAIEVTFWVAFVIAAACAVVLDLSAVGMLALVAVCALLRLAVYLLGASARN